MKCMQFYFLADNIHNLIITSTFLLATTSCNDYYILHIIYAIELVLMVIFNG